MLERVAQRKRIKFFEDTHAGTDEVPEKKLTFSRARMPDQKTSPLPRGNDESSESKKNRDLEVGPQRIEVLGSGSGLLLRFLAVEGRGGLGWCHPSPSQ